MPLEHKVPKTISPKRAKKIRQTIPPIVIFAGKRLRWSDRHFFEKNEKKIFFQFCYVYSIDILFTILKYFYLAHIQ